MVAESELLVGADDVMAMVAAALPRFHGETLEDHAAEWIQLKREVSIRQFKLGAIAASLEKNYGQNVFAAFARTVGEKPRTIYLYAQVFRECYQFCKRLQNLAWSHFAIVTRLGLPPEEKEQLLIEAADNKWSTPKLKREAMIRQTIKELEDSPAIDPEIAQAISEWKDLKPRIEKFQERHRQFWLLCKDFLGGIDDEVDRPWDSAREFLERLIELGVRDSESLRRATRFQKYTIEAMCDELVATGDYDYVWKGGETDVARGAKVKLIKLKGEPAGDQFTSRREAQVGGWDFD